MTDDPFAPQPPSRCAEEEYGYRRGFDQGVASVLQALFPERMPGTVGLHKERCKLFRIGRVKEAPWLTPEEAQSILMWIVEEDPWL